MKVRIKFAKRDAMRYIGHLDVMRYFQKVIRRAEIPIAFSSGYSPHMIMSFACPLGLGVTSEGEYFDIEITEPISSKEAVARMNETGVKGMEVLSFKQIPSEKKSSGMTILAGARYLVTFLCPFWVDSDSKITYTEEDLKKAFHSFMAQPEINILKETKRSVKEVNIKPLIHDLKVKRDFVEEGSGVEESLAVCDGDSIHRECSEKGSSKESFSVEMTLSAGSKENLKPSLVIKAFCSFLGKEVEEFAYHVHRLEMYANDGDDEDIRFVSLESLGEEIV